MYRQAIEAACLSILLSHQGKLTPNSNKLDDFYFKDIFKADKQHQKPYQFAPLIVKNQTALGVDDEFLKFLEKSKKIFNKYSHASKLTVDLSQTGGNKSSIFFGWGNRAPRVKNIRSRARLQVYLCKDDVIRY